MQLFQDGINKCKLMILAWLGHGLRGRDQGVVFLSECLSALIGHIAMTGGEWLFLMLIFKVVPHIDFFDHYPLLLCLHGNANDRRERPFIFESAWLTHPTFKVDMQGWWSKYNDLYCNVK